MEPITVTIKFARTKTEPSKHLPVRIAKNVTISELKAVCRPEVAEPNCIIKFIQNGQVLDDAHTLDELGIQDGTVIHLIRSFEVPPAQPLRACAPLQDAYLSPGLFQDQYTVEQLPSAQATQSMDNVRDFIKNPNRLQQILRDPTQNQMIQNMFSDPKFIESLYATPFFNRILTANPLFQEAFASPNLMQQMITAMSGQAPQGASGTPVQAPGLNSQVTNAMQGMMGAQPAVPPQQKYAGELSRLKEMGFTDEAAMISALEATDGQLDSAIERLFSN